MEHSIESLDLKPSKGGVFEVSVDGTLLYSKKSTGRHAKSGEVMNSIREHLGS